MTLPGKGKLSLSDIKNEFNKGNSLSEYYGVAPKVPTSGKISFSNFYNTKNIINKYVTSNVTNARFSQFFTKEEMESKFEKNLIINNGVYLGGGSYSPALLFDVTPEYSKYCTIKNYGNILGAARTDAGNIISGCAIQVNDVAGVILNIDNQGLIYAGGGQGGAGGQGGRGGNGYYVGEYWTAEAYNFSNNVVSPPPGTYQYVNYLVTTATWGNYVTWNTNMNFHSSRSATTEITLGNTTYYRRGFKQNSSDTWWYAIQYREINHRFDTSGGQGGSGGSPGGIGIGWNNGSVRNNESGVAGSLGQGGGVNAGNGGSGGWSGWGGGWGEFGELGSTGNTGSTGNASSGNLGYPGQGGYAPGYVIAPSQQPSGQGFTVNWINKGDVRGLQ